jgi:hypothetical protein
VPAVRRRQGAELRPALRARRLPAPAR